MIGFWELFDFRKWPIDKNNLSDQHFIPKKSSLKFNNIF